MLSHGHSHGPGGHSHGGNSHGYSKAEQATPMVFDENLGLVEKQSEPEVPVVKLEEKDVLHIPFHIREEMQKMISQLKRAGQLHGDADEFAIMRQMHDEMMAEREEMSKRLAAQRKGPSAEIMADLGAPVQKNPIVELAQETSNDAKDTTELHIACLQANTQAVALMLARGFDPNVVNKLGQTPVHAAASVAEPCIIHLLCKHGADVKIKDYQGWTAMHHAASSTSELAPHTLHYLNECQGLPYYELTNDNETLLHLATKSKTSHLKTLLDVLLVPERLNVYQTDANGNTALHYVVAEQNMIACYRIVSSAGAKLLLIPNKNSRTSLDMARKLNTVGGRMISAEFDKWIAKGEMFKPNSMKPLEFYKCFLLPILVYTIVSIITVYTVTLYQGWICGAAMCAIYGFVSRQSHRIDHISGLANPVYMGYFLIITSMSLVFFLHSLSYVFTTRPITCSIIMISWPPMMYLYSQLVIKDAGILSESKKKDSGEFYTMYDLVDHFKRPIIWCPTCKIIPSKPAKHCKLCERCHQWMDHHCLYTMNCIAFRNFHKFVLFSLFLLFGSLLTMSLLPNYMYTTSSEEESVFAMLKRFFNTRGSFAVFFLVNIIMIVGFFAPMAARTIKNIAGGYTELFSPQSPAFKSGLTFPQKIRNVFHFLIKGKVLMRDPAYNI